MSVPGETNARLDAARIVDEWLGTGRFPQRLLDENAPVQRAFTAEIVYGVVRWLRLLDWVIARCTERPDADLRPFLLVGVYQLLFMDRTAEHAAVYETVAAAARAFPRGRGFVNAVLRRVQRERETLLEELERRPRACRQSHPDLLVERWTRVYGEEATEALCAWNNGRAPTCIHPLAGRVDPDRFAAELAEAGVDAAVHAADGRFLVLPFGTRVFGLPGFEEGRFSVQDPSQAVPVDLLDPRPGERVLDACAAPGGKTVLAAERMEGQGEVVAMDVSDSRLERLRDNMRRLRLTNADARCADAAGLDPIRDGMFDRVLLDVPCSNTGVLRRRPDARWRFSMKLLRQCTALQRALLDAAFSVLKPGGTLVYSTCSLEPEEGPELVGTCRSLHPELELVAERRLLPPGCATDGGYAVALRKP